MPPAPRLVPMLQRKIPKGGVVPLVSAGPFTKRRCKQVIREWRILRRLVQAGGFNVPRKNFIVVKVVHC